MFHVQINNLKIWKKKTLRIYQNVIKNKLTLTTGHNIFSLPRKVK